MYAMRCIQIIYLTTETLCYENKQTDRRQQQKKRQVAGVSHVGVGVGML